MAPDLLRRAGYGRGQVTRGGKVIMKQHLIILELAAQGKLPEKIDSASHLSVTVVRELIDAGYLKAIDASSLEGIACIQPKITLAGREYLARHRNRTEGKEMQANKYEQRPLDLATDISDVSDAWPDKKGVWRIQEIVWQEHQLCQR